MIDFVQHVNEQMPAMHHLSIRRIQNCHFHLDLVRRSQDHRISSGQHFKQKSQDKESTNAHTATTMVNQIRASLVFIYV